MHPTIFRTELFTLHTLWLMVAVGIIAATYTMIKLSIRNSLKLQFLSDNSWKMVFFSLLGARLLSVAINYKTYFSSFDSDTLLQLLYIWDKGLNLYGAFLGFFIYLFYACKKREDQSFWKWIDVIIPAFIVGMAFGHMGAFFEGINYGRDTSLPWGVNFESPWIKYTVPVHPTQIYAFLYSILTATIFIFISQMKKFKESAKEGVIGLGALSAYSLFRTLEGFIRGDDVLMIWIFRIPQVISFAVLIFSGILLLMRYNKADKQ